MCESKDFVYFGDTRMKSSFKVFKGALEILFTNKTHILFKNTQDKFVFNKPKVYLSGIINGIPKYDYEGEDDFIGEYFYSDYENSVKLVNVEEKDFMSKIDLDYKIMANQSNDAVY